MHYFNNAKYKKLKGIMILYPYIISIAAIGFLVFIHELGHFLFCKLFKIKVTQFTIGFGPKLFSKKCGSTEYGISLFPIGGFVEIDENESETLQILPLWKSTLMLLGGILYNLLFAYITITSIVLYNNDIIKHTNLKLFYPQQYISIKDREGTVINLDYQCKIELLSNIKPCEFTLKDLYGERIIFENENFFNSYFTIEDPSITIKNTFELVQTTIKLINNIIFYSMKSILNIFKKLEVKKLSGMIGIIATMKQVLENKGIIDFLIILSFISINLGLFNLLPLPILDGGKLLIVIMTKIIGKKLSEKTELWLAYGSMIIFGLITIYSTYYDLIRIYFNS
jgi:regulator of sigma E protease